MPKEVEDCVQSVLADNPDYDESRAYAICNAQHSKDDSEALARVGTDLLGKREIPISVKFKAQTRGGMGVIAKKDGEGMLIWGPASVEVVDKERDIIRSEALERALPQLLRRERISVDHSDQLVGRIKEGIETDEPTEVNVAGTTITRKDFPTAVLTPEEDNVPEKGLYVAAEIWDDTRQARNAQEKIKDGEFDSYSISGETLSASTQVKDGDFVEDISEIDLSAVTLCESGMNQKAKFGVVEKEDHPAFNSLENTMKKSDTSDDPEVEEKTLEAFKEAARDVLPEGQLATKDDFESFEASLREKYGLEAEEKQLDSDEAQEAVLQLADATGQDPDELADVIRNAVEGSDEDVVEAEDDEDMMDDEDMPPEDDDDEVDTVDADDLEDPDDDGEMEIDVTDDDPDGPDDDDMEDTEDKSLVQQLEEKGVPDDLVDAVKQYVPDDGSNVEMPPEEKNEDYDEEADDDMEEEKEESDEPDIPDVSKSEDPAATAISGAFDVAGTGPVAGGTVEKKSYSNEDFDDDEESESLVAVDQFYKSQNIETEEN